MKAVIFNEYGGPDVLQVKEIEKPIPKDNEILIKIFSNSVNYGDVMVRNFKNLPLSKFNMPLPFWLPTRLMFGYNKPKRNILGSEFAGKIESIGKDVNLFNPGDEVFGYRADKLGANSEYLCVPENSMVAIKPNNMSYEESCTIPYGGTTAFNILKKANIQPGQKVLINGASGSIGSAALQLAKYYGAEVTGVCGTPRLDFVKSLGADKAIDYTKEDFTKNGETYDLIFDILGKSRFSQCKNSLTENGIYLRASFKMREIVQMFWTKLFSSKKVICAITPEKIENLNAIKDLMEKGKIKSIIDKIFPLDQTAKAHRYYESGEKKGEVIIILNN